MFKNAYRKIHEWANHRHAIYYLVGISFLEAFCLPITPLFLLIPMVIATPEKSWRLVNLATLAASIGSIIGYYIGYQFIEVVHPWIEKVGYGDEYQAATELYAKWEIFALFISSVTIIPFKFFTIISGVAQTNFLIFILVVIVVRWIHFASIPIAIHWFAKPMMKWVREKYE